jgi:hypothetical protein
MTDKPSDVNSDGEKNKTVGNAQSEAESAVKRMYNVVNIDRNAAKAKLNNPEIAQNAPATPEAATGESTSSLSHKTSLNYYEGKLSAGAGSTAEAGLKGLFNTDRLNTMLSANNDSPGPYHSTRVDGLNPKKDPLQSSFKVPDFVPKFPSA